TTVVTTSSAAYRAVPTTGSIIHIVGSSKGSIKGGTFNIFTTGVSTLKKIRVKWVGFNNSNHKKHGNQNNKGSNREFHFIVITWYVMGVELFKENFIFQTVGKFWKNEPRDL
ncbi:44861_t:CDS:1, partial [Gigaspora margarita]